ncbi:hypothetical protein [Streptomyces sp. NPDC048256]|uniref:hypothetical protein n=1 Tax=unclassified Streptomyces TaxID=2593676 RepID=UPI00340E2384
MTSPAPHNYCRADSEASKLRAYAQLHHNTPHPVGRRRAVEAVQEEWQRRYPLFPRLLLVLDDTGPASTNSRIRALGTQLRWITRSPSPCER